MTNVVTGFYTQTYNIYNPIVNTGRIYLTTGDGLKQITSTFSSGGCDYIAPTKSITLDLLPPTT